MTPVFTSFFIFTASVILCRAENIPCNAVKRESGFICVCNSTYCDTIEPPGKLKEREFHVYSTSNSRPGFNHYTDYFKIQSFAPHGIKIEVDDKRKRQKIRGFGGSFTDSFGYMLNKLSTGTRENLLRSYFSENGVEYTLCRLVLGSSDFSLRPYTYLEKFDPSLKSFNLTEDDYLYKIPCVKKALSMTKRKINLLGSTWTAPPWMKKNLKMDPGVLMPKYRQAWADYHVKCLDAYKKEGIEMWGLTTGNEPITFTVIKVQIANLIMYPEEQREWIANNLGPTLERAGYGDKAIILMDDQRRYIMWYMDTVMKNREARKYINGIGLHWYFDTDTSPIILDHVNNKFPDQEIMYTESSINLAMRSLDDSREVQPTKPPFEPTRPEFGSWRRASIYITSIIENLSHWVTAYLDWNLALDTDGGPNERHVTCDPIIAINETSDEIYKQPTFYVMGHFSKFILPGAYILDLKSVLNKENKVRVGDGHSSLDSFTTGPTVTLTTPSRPPTMFPTSFTYYDVTYVGALNPDGSHSIIIFNPKKTSAEVAIHDPAKGYGFVVLEPESLTTVVY